MIVSGFELRRIGMPLVAPFRTSFGLLTERDVLLVRARTPEADGWAECAAISAPSYSSEYVEAAAHVIRHHLIPLVASLPVQSAAVVNHAFRRVKGHVMAKSAIETAILDAELRSRGMSFSSFLGGVSTKVPAGVSIGITRSVDELLDSVRAYLAEGYLRVKLKIQPGWDSAPVRAVRERFPDLLLQVDANTAYTPADARLLAGLDVFDLLLIEQPFAEDDVRGHAALARMIRTPVCLDESINSARAAADAIAMGACSAVNIKPGRVGGYVEARRIHDVCAANGVPVWCGGMLETGIGRAANAALAALPNFTLPGDISASSRYYARDITTPFRLENGHVAVPTGSGIGVQPDLDVLDEVTRQVEWIGCRS